MSASSSDSEAVVDPDRRTREPGWFEEWKAARVEDNDRMGRIEEATGRLSADAKALNSTLETYKANVAKVEETTVTKSDHEARWEEATAAALTEFARIRFLTILVGVGFFLLSLVGLAATATLITNAQDRMEADRLEECRVRVDSSKQGLVKFEALLNSPTVADDPALKAFVQAARDTSLRGSQVQC